MALSGDEREVVRSIASGAARAADAPPIPHPTEAELIAAREALQARERELSLIYANVSDVIFYIAVEPAGRYRFMSVNQAFLTATGLTEAQVVGRTVDEVIPQPSLSIVLRHYETACRERRSVRWEETTPYPAGLKVGEVTVTPVYENHDGAGACTHLIGTVHDVTERSHASEIRGRLAAIVESSDDAIVSKTLEGIVTSWNNGAQRFNGIQPVAGPFAQPSASRPTFRYIDSTGTPMAAPVANRSSIALVRADLRGQTRLAQRALGTAVRRADSSGAWILLHNRR